MLDLLNATSRPPQPVPLGATIWDYRIDARQPALLFADTMGLGPIADSVLALFIYHPNRFNLRYD